MPLVACLLSTGFICEQERRLSTNIVYELIDSEQGISDAHAPNASRTVPGECLNGLSTSH